MICLQETKIEVLHKEKCFAIQGDNIQWVKRSTENWASGLITVWCKNKFIYHKHVSGKGFFMTIGKYRRDNILILVVNVFSFYDYNDKAQMW